MLLVTPRFAFLLTLAAVVVATTLGPMTTLTIANKDISPDGFSRSYVVFHSWASH